MSMLIEDQYEVNTDFFNGNTALLFANFPTAMWEAAGRYVPAGTPGFKSLTETWGIEQGMLITLAFKNSIFEFIPPLLLALKVLAIANVTVYDGITTWRMGDDAGTVEVYHTGIETSTWQVRVVVVQLGKGIDEYRYNADTFDKLDFTAAVLTVETEKGK